MAFFVYQGGKQFDSIRWIYDGLPIVTANSDIASHDNHVYLCRVSYFDGQWKTLGTLQSRGNKLNYGVFDVMTLGLSGYPYTTGPIQTMAADSTYNDDAQSYAGREWYLRCELGWQSDTQLATYPTTKYYRVIGGALTDTFTSALDTDPTLYIFKTTQGKFMSVRHRQGTKIDVDVSEGDRYSVTYLPSRKLSTGTDTTYESTLDNFLVQIVFLGGGGSQLQSFDVTREIVDVDNQAVPQTANGLLLREFSFGPKDIRSLTQNGVAVYSTAMRNKIIDGTWDYIRLFPRNSSNGVIGSNTQITLHNKKKTNPDRCKNQIQLKFRNRIGGFDYVQTTMYVQRKMNVTREKYTSNNLNFDSVNNVVDLELNDAHKQTGSSNATLVNDTYTVSTGYLSDNDNKLIAELLQSNEVYAMRWRDNKGGADSDGKFYPCNIATTDMSYMYNETDKLVEYKFDIEFSNKPRPLI